MQKLYPVLLRADCKDYIWGSPKLKLEYNKETNLESVAESWELACRHDGMSKVLNGPYAGLSMAQYLRRVGDRVLGKKGQFFDKFPLLVKILNADKDLSLQVHPDAFFASQFAGESSKNEFWYIAECKPGATMVYGLKGVIGKEEFRQRIEDNTLMEACNVVEVHKGDIFYVPVGTLHAIGAGIVLVEVQQNANTTYRVYDYGRRDKNGNLRDLHVEKALQVTKLEKARSTGRRSKVQQVGDAKVRKLIKCPYFTVYHVDLAGLCNLPIGLDSFQTITVTEGNVELTANEVSLELRKGNSVFLPAGLGECRYSGTGEFILSRL